MKLNEIANMSDVKEGSSSSSSNKVLLDPSIPIEELLGSVTTYNNVEGSDGSEVKSFQLRTSARVFKKMRLDSALAALPVPEKKELEKKDEPKPETKKSMRPFWTGDDKNLFFEALNEYGKDFEAIHSYVSAKLKKKGVPENMLKTKEQIRHLYYRTWHKISKHLKFSDEVKKLAQELYGLINYGELRKKMTSVSEKTLVKLNELVYRGSLAIRIKGKTLRARTPMCRALRRLNQIDENTDDIKLPNRITVELKPKDMATWMRVQEISQNPRVKTVVPLQKRLSSLVTYMSERWKSNEVVEHEKLIATAENLVANDMADIKLDHVKPRSDPPLRLTPPTDRPIAVPTINLTEYFSTHSICLNAYEELINVKNPGEQIWLRAYPNMNKSSLKKGVKRVRAESTSETKAVQYANRPSVSTTMDNNENIMETEMTLDKVDRCIDKAVNMLLSLQNPENGEELTANTVKEEKLEAIKVEDEALVKVKKEDDIARIKLGWTLQDCGTLTVGDVYLMCGSDAKVTLEYSWDSTSTAVKSEVETLKEINVENDLNEMDVDNSDNCINKESSVQNDNELSATLKRLLSMAKLHYRKNIVKCPCGHVCGSPSKNSAARSSTGRNGVKHYRLNNCGELVQTSQQQPSTSTSTVITLQQNITTTGSLVPIGIQTQIRKFSPSSLFRRPNSPNSGLREQLKSIQRLKPRYCNRKGRRPRPKQVVVERKLPFSAANSGESGSSHQIVQMNLISQDRQIPPPKIVPQIELSANAMNQSESQGIETTLTPVALRSDEDTGTVTIVSLQDTGGESLVPSAMLDNATTPSRIGSPTSISNLLDMALQTHHNGLNNGDSVTEGITSFQGILSENNIASSPPPTPTRILKESDNQWLNTDDFSMTSFLGHLDSSMKSVQTTSIPNEDTRMCMSQDVDAQLQSLLTENSLDYMAKFADLAAQVTNPKS